MKPIAIMLGAALAGMAMPARADVKQGIAAWERGDYPAAVKEWRPPAQKGDADAQFNLGQAYRLGRGVPVDMQMAESWYGKAARQGHVDAEDNYGLCLFQNGKRQEAMPWIEKSAARGDPRAQYVLGTAQFNGDLAPKDWVRAYALMTRSVAGGFPKAMVSIAEMDKYIPLEQRQRGTALARDLETAAGRGQPVLASAAPIQAASPPPPAAAFGASTAPGASYPEPGKAPAPVQAGPPAATVLAPPREVVQPIAETAQTAGTANADAWRIQLGAFGNPDNATALWSSLEHNVDGLSAVQPYLVKSASVTRLQAGPFASRTDAESQCAAVRSAGQACLTVRP